MTILRKFGFGCFSEGFEVRGVVDPRNFWLFVGLGVTSFEL